MHILYKVNKQIYFTYYISLLITYFQKLRDTQDWKSIASYYIETLCLHELQIFQNSNGVSSTFLFFTVSR